MLTLLSLDSPPLRRGREQALEGVFPDDFIVNASAEDLARIAHGFRQLDAQGALPDFGHVVARYAEQLLMP